MVTKSSYQDVVNVIHAVLQGTEKPLSTILLRVGNTPHHEPLRDARDLFLELRRGLKKALAERVRSDELMVLTVNFLDAASNLLKAAPMYTNFDFSDVLPSAIDIIQKSRDELNKYSDREAESGASNSSRIHDLLDIENARARLSVSLENQEERILNLQTSLEDFSSQFSKSLDPLTERFQQALSSYDEHFRYLEEKRDQVDDLVGLLGGKAVAGSYETNALEEQRTANNLRWGSIAFMVLILGVVGYSFIEATTAGFNLQNSVLRLVYSLLLSVPAAYLARESSKHRQQQYMHLQTALDLKAITPYIASLPPDIQNKLKEEMASKIFTPRTFDHLTKESYPINTQELVLALLSKIETKESVKKDRKEEKEKA